MRNELLFLTVFFSKFSRGTVSAIMWTISSGGVNHYLMISSRHYLSEIPELINEELPYGVRGQRL